MKKRIVVDYQYHAIEFNEELSAVVNAMVEANIKGESVPRKIESYYDNIYVQSTECEDYAERALEILRERYPRYEFAAHSDATTLPPNSYWRLLAKTQSGRAINKEQMRKIRGAAKRILLNIEAKYPEVAEKQHREIEKKSKRSGFWGTILDIFDP